MGLVVLSATYRAPYVLEAPMEHIALTDREQRIVQALGSGKGWYLFVPTEADPLHGWLRRDHAHDGPRTGMAVNADELAHLLAADAVQLDTDHRLRGQVYVCSEAAPQH
jgi:hypothetical protein